MFKIFRLFPRNPLCVDSPQHILGISPLYRKRFTRKDLQCFLKGSNSKFLVLLMITYRILREYHTQLILQACPQDSFSLAGLNALNL